MTSISLLPELLVIAEDDSFVVVDESEALTANRTKRIAKSNIALVTPTANAIPQADAAGKLAVGWMPNTTGLDGWTPVTGTFSWASASTITISAGGASVYSVGDRLKWVTATGSTQRYGTVVTVANALLTIAVNTDHVLANEAWTLPYYSHQASPVGYPDVFNWTPIAGASSGTLTSYTSSGTFSIVGRRATLEFLVTITSSNNNGYLLVTPPFTFVDVWGGARETITGKMSAVSFLIDGMYFTLYDNAFTNITNYAYPTTCVARI